MNTRLFLVAILLLLLLVECHAQQSDNDNKDTNDNKDSKDSKDNKDTKDKDNKDNSDIDPKVPMNYGSVQFTVPPPTSISRAFKAVLFPINSVIKFNWTYKDLTSPPANISVRFRYRSSTPGVGYGYHYIANQVPFEDPMVLKWDTKNQKPEDFQFQERQPYHLQIYDPATNPDTTNGVPENFGMLQARYLPFYTYWPCYVLNNCELAIVKSEND